MDFVKKRRPDIPNHRLVVIGRFVTFGFMTLAILWAPQIVKFPNIWTYLQQMLAYLAPPIVACFFAGVFWKRANGTGAFAALVTGHAAAAVIFVLALSGVVIVQTQALTPEQLTRVTGGTPVIHFLYVAPIVLLVSLLALVAVSLATAPPEPGIVRDLTWSRAMLTAERPMLDGLPWYKNYRYQSLALLVLMAVVVVAWW
jgi:SSS family solute:Na+ symporter